MRYFIGFLMLTHGLIHLLGFIKAFGISQINQLTREISKPVGIIWLVTALLMIIASAASVLKKDGWWGIAFAGIPVSQLLIFLYWKDAKFGTIPNLMILLVAMPFFFEWNFETKYKRDVNKNLNHTNNHTETLLTIEGISHLPEPVQRYIIYSGAINKPILNNFKIKFEGRIRSDEKSVWMPFTTEQYNFIENPWRLFFMKAKMKGLPVTGYHVYKNGLATMDIRLFSVFTVQYQAGMEMNVAETVTWLNDLCLYAPAALIDKRIQWETIDRLQVKAIFQQEGINVSATLQFNENGELTNFVSEDRYRILSNSDRKQIRFSTPVKNYIDVDERKVPGFGEAVWHLTDGAVTYGEFTCTAIEYNVTK
jgi:hypothetical protein